MATRASTTIALSTLLSRALSPALSAALLLPATAMASEVADGDKAAPEGTVGFVVVRENGSGSASSAQSLIDDLLDVIAKGVGWADADGKYTTKRSVAKKYIKESKPSFGFLSYGMYLGLRKSHDLTPLASIDKNANGSAQFFLVSKNQFTVDGCKGKVLASNHAGDKTFINNVVSGGAFSLADFEVSETRRPVQTIKAVLDGEAECALIDEAQVVAMTKVEGGGALRPVWASKAMPAFVIAAFGTATDAQTKAFRPYLSRICESPEGQATCDASGISDAYEVKADHFAADQAAYDK